MKHFIAYVTSLAVVLVASLVVAASGYMDAALFVSYGGTFFVIILFLGVAVVDSKTRWPEASAWQRLVNILSFTR